MANQTTTLSSARTQGLGATVVHQSLPAVGFLRGYVHTSVPAERGGIEAETRGGAAVSDDSSVAWTGRFDREDQRLIHSLGDRDRYSRRPVSGVTLRWSLEPSRHGSGDDPPCG
jgi:hypothetical protein